MELLKGAPVADAILAQVQADIEKLPSKPHLGIVLVGNDEGSLSYIGRKKAAAEKVGIRFSLYHLEVETSENEILALLEKLNTDTDITGYIVQLPLPAHISVSKIFESIHKEKDVDGFHPHNIGQLFLGASEDTYLPAATSRAVIKLFEFYHTGLAGMEVCILGKGPVVGRPLALELLHKGATVTVCHSRTRDLQKHIASADIIISAIGKPHFIDTASMKQGAIAVDVGFYKKDGKIYGDILPPADGNTLSGFVPVPGGIGPVTVAVLMENIVKAYKMQYPSSN